MLRELPEFCFLALFNNGLLTEKIPCLSYYNYLVCQLSSFCLLQTFVCLVSSTPLSLKLGVSSLVPYSRKKCISSVRTQFLILEEVYAWGAPSQHDERSPLPSSTGTHTQTCKKNKKIETKEGREERARREMRNGEHFAVIQ